MNVAYACETATTRQSLACFAHGSGARTTDINSQVMVGATGGIVATRHDHGVHAKHTNRDSGSTKKGRMTLRVVLVPITLCTEISIFPAC